MTAVLAVFAFVKENKWVFWVLLALAILWGAVHWYHDQIDAAEQRGRDAQVLEDNKASDALRAQVKDLTAKNQDLGNKLEARYEAEHAANIAGANQPVGTSQLCKPAPTHSGGVDLHTAVSADGLHESTPASSSVGSPVPAPDNGQSDDRRRLLGAFAALFDDQNAVVRSFQSRDLLEHQP